MAKHKKTRKQKLLADLRRQTQSTVSKEPDSTTYSIPVSISDPASISKPHAVSTYAGSVQAKVVTIDYRYLITDLRKTILLTSAIVIAELVIKFWLKI